MGINYDTHTTILSNSHVIIYSHVKNMGINYDMRIP
jgi:hypothetical protein